MCALRLECAVSLPSLPAGRSSKRCDGSSCSVPLCTCQSAPRHSIRIRVDGMYVAPGQGLATSPARPHGLLEGPQRLPSWQCGPPARETHHLTRSQGPCLTVCEARCPGLNSKSGASCVLNLKAKQLHVLDLGTLHNSPYPQVLGSLGKSLSPHRGSCTGFQNP